MHFFLSILCSAAFISAQPSIPKLLYGVAYYDEYMPYERLDKDIAMMKEAGINVVRIAESTWSTVEPQDGVYDFSHIDRVLNAMNKAGISVKYGQGTATYIGCMTSDSITKKIVQNAVQQAGLWGE